MVLLCELEKSPRSDSTFSACPYGYLQLELAGAMQEPHAAVVTLFLRQHGHPLRSLTLDFTEGVDASELIMVRGVRMGHR